MPYFFPGMNPYLEEPQLWPEVHSRLIVAMADALNPQVMPNYRVAVERIVEEVRESYLEIRDVVTGIVVTVIELLSPKNKQAGPGREAYEAKRSRVLGSRANFVEIDLLRAGRAMARIGAVESSLYSVIISRAQQRPEADWYGFGLQETMPKLLIPLRLESESAVLDLQRVVQETYDRAGFDLAIAYDQPPPLPLLSEEDRVWVMTRLAK